MKKTILLNLKLYSQYSIFFALLTAFLFSIAVQAQPEYSQSNIGLIKGRKFNRDAFRPLSEMETSPFTQILNRNDSFLTDGNLDSSFNTSVTEGSGYVNETVVQLDGKIIAVGLFQRTNGVMSNGIARFNHDGTLDSSFNAGGGANNVIRAVALQPDGKIIVGGAFTFFNNQARNRIVRLNSDGSIDSTFNLTTTLTSQVYDIAIQTDGKMLVSGVFNSSSSRLIRLYADGTVDSSFSSIVNGVVQTIVILPNSKIFIGGSFYLPHSQIARLNNDGTVDNSFAPSGGGNGGSVVKIVVQPNGKILVGGDFSSFNGMATDALVRLNDNGTVDTTFEIINDPNSDSLDSQALAIQPDGKILAGYNSYNYFSGVSSVIRFNTEGTIDTSFTAGNSNSSPVTDINVLADGRILIGGNFVSYNNQTHLRLIRTDANGNIDNTFNASASTLGVVSAVKRQPDGKIILGGDFQFVNGIRQSNIARLNTDGTLDTKFNIGTGIYGKVYALLIQPDGKIIVGGTFFSYNNIPVYCLARINPDGSFDLSLNNGNGVDVYTTFALAIQPDGKLLVGGDISDSYTGYSRALARVNVNGLVDTTFTSPFISGSIRTIAVQPDQRIIIGGNFFISNTTTQRNGIARLNSDGSLDNTGFTTNQGLTFALAQQPDGKIYAGGSTLARFNSSGTIDTTFTGGTGSYSIRAIEIQSNGKVIIGGSIPTYNNIPVNNIARLNLDSSLDSTFSASASGTIFGLALQPDGKVIAGGQFSNFNNTEKSSLVRLQNSTLPRATPFDFDGDSKADISVFRSSTGVWYLQNSAQGFSALQFGANNDLIAPADYDGDGKTDVAVFRPSTGVWYVLRSSNNTVLSLQFGVSGDLPRPGDFDGDGKADISVFRPSNGVWYRLNSSNNQFITVNFGQSGDAPMIGDFDGDGTTDTAIFRQSDGVWYRLDSSNGQFSAVQFGQSGDIPSPADFDGDGKTDIGVFRPSNGIWYRLNSSNGQFLTVQFGTASDIPAAADYDGDGRADVSVFRPSNGTWYRLNSTNNSFFVVQFGISGDKPAPAAFLQ